MSEFLHLVSSFDFRSPSWDLFILAIWAVVSVIYAFAAGRGRVVNILISTYLAKLIVIEAPFLNQFISKKIGLSPALVSFTQLISFLALFLVLFLLMGRYVFRTSADSHKISAMLFSVIFALFQIGLLINIIIGYLPTATQGNFSPLIKTVFIGSTASLIWLLAPLVYLITLGKFVSEDDEV